MKFLLILLLSFSYSLQASESVIAKVGEKEITQSDLKTFMELFPGPSPSLGIELSKPNYSLKQIINFHLILKEIEDEGFNQKEKTKIFLQNALISYFLNEKIDKFIQKNDITYEQIKNYYKNNPVVDIQRIALAFQDQASLNNAVSTLKLLKRDLDNKKISFNKAVLKADKYNGRKGFNGEFKHIFKDDFILEEKAAIESLDLNEYSDVITGNGAVEIIKVTKIYPFSKNYTEKIKQIIYLKKIYKARKQYFDKLQIKNKDIIKINK